MNINTKQLKFIAGRIVLWIVLIPIIVYSTFPVYWAFVSSFKSQPELFGNPPTLFVENITLQNYVDLLTKTPAPQWFVNSLIVSVSATSICIVLASFGAYSLTRFRFRGRYVLANGILFVYMFPAIMVGIPLFFFLDRLNLLDSLLGLIIAYSSITLPFTLWLLRAFFQSIPLSLEEAAFVDGATRAQTLRIIVLPLALPGIVASAVFTMITCWNEYVFAFLFIFTETYKTVPVGLHSFLTQHGNLWQYIFPLTILSAVPLFLFFLYIEKHLLETLGGALKG